MLAATAVKKSSQIKAQCEQLIHRSFPKFLLNPNLVTNTEPTFEDLDYTVVLTKQDKVVAFGITIPFNWSGHLNELPTFNHMVTTGLQIQSLNQDFNSLAGYAICISPDEQGKGLATTVIEEMKNLARKANCEHCIMPVRPSEKIKYPLQSLTDYSKWRRSDGQLLDQWLRIHENKGAKYLEAIESCDVYSGSLEDWSESTGMVFPTSGSYIVPGAISPLIVDVDKDIGTLSEGHVWVNHPLD